MEDGKPKENTGGSGSKTADTGKSDDNPAKKLRLTPEEMAALADMMVMKLRENPLMAPPKDTPKDPGEFS